MFVRSFRSVLVNRAKSHVGSISIPKRQMSNTLSDDEGSVGHIVDRADLIQDVLENQIQLSDPNDDVNSWLDPLNPPILNYEHLQLIKNIDYSPIIKRARKGGMFSVDDVISIIEETNSYAAFNTNIDKEAEHDVNLFSESFDVFNKGQKKCPLCLPDPTVERMNRIHYTNVNLLLRYVNERGMILSRKVSGVCKFHQTRLRSAIKSARSLALLSTTSNARVPVSFTKPDILQGHDQLAGTTVEITTRAQLYQDYLKYGSPDRTINSFDDYLRDWNMKHYKHEDPDASRLEDRDEDMKQEMADEVEIPNDRMDTRGI